MHLFQRNCKIYKINLLENKIRVLIRRYFQIVQEMALNKIYHVKAASIRAKKQIVIKFHRMEIS